jgi:alkylhydroperoxidase family enzyme
MTENFAPISDADWPEAIADMLPGFAGGLNVYRTMAHHPALLKAWSNLREHVVNQTSLGAMRSEVVILRSGMRLGSRYEWQQHIIRARKAGLSDARIARLNGPLPEIEGEDHLLASAVDQLFDRARLDEETIEMLTDVVGKSGLLDVMATVGFYSTLGFILNSFQTPLDDDIAQALARASLAP